MSASRAQANVYASTTERRTRRLLVVANEAVATDTLRELIGTVAHSETDLDARGRSRELAGTQQRRPARRRFSQRVEQLRAA
jgi:hypothetical protein